VRLFVAVTPPVAVVEMLRAVRRPEVPGLRWTTADQWHVTLHFVGETTEPGAVADALCAVPEALRTEGVTALEAILGPASAWFPGRRVLQVPVAGLEALAGAVTRALGRSAEPGSAEPGYAGHLTLARTRGRAKGPARLAGVPLAARWPVGQVELVSSVPGPGGSRYRTEAAVDLGGPPGGDGGR